MSTQVAEPPEAASEDKTVIGNMAEIFDATMKGKTVATVKDPIQPKQAAVEQPNDEKKVEKAAVTEPAKSTVDSLLNPDAAKPGTEDADPLEEFKDDKNPNVKRMREVIGDYRDKFKESRKEISRLTELAKNAGTSEELKKQLEAIAQERDEMRAYVKAADITQDPEFKTKFIDGRKALLEKAAKRLENAGGAGFDLLEAHSLIGKKRAEALKEALSSADESDRRKIESILDQVDELDEARDEALKNPDKTWEQIQSQRKTQTAAEIQKAEQARVSEIEAVAADLPNEFFMLRKADPAAPDAEAWNAEVTKANDAVKYLMGPDAAARDVAATILKGLRAEPLQALFIAERKARMEAEVELSKYRAASPEIKGGPGPASAEKKSWERPIGDAYQDALKGGSQGV